MSVADYLLTKFVGRIDGSAAGLPEPAAPTFSGRFPSRSDERPRRHRLAERDRRVIRVATPRHRRSNERPVLDEHRHRLTLHLETHRLDAVDLGQRVDDLREAEEERRP